MYILENVPLSSLSTMRLGGNAGYICNIENKNELVEAHNWAKEREIPIKLIGGGSNIIWTDEGFEGLVAINKIKGFEIFEIDEESIYATIGSGENWDKIVDRCVEKGLSGIENLSLIPGTVGATPVQNVGAYGTEIKDVLITLEAFDRKTEKFVNIRGSECEFGYRTSRFKTKDKDRFLISSVTLSLSTKDPLPPFYGAVENYLSKNGITKFTAKEIRKAVIDIRTEKLPDPNKVANCGSFFHNPIIERDKAMELVRQYPDMPHWEVENYKFKLSAAWLVENSGFEKGYIDDSTGMGLWKNQALVVVNVKATKTSQLMEFREKLTNQVFNRFGIKLNQEPEIV